MEKLFICTIVLMVLAACDDDKVDNTAEQYVSTSFVPEEVYAGGKLGTVFNATSYAFQQPTPSCEQSGMATAFKFGEYFFERDFTQGTDGAFPGLGPLMVRNGCLYCHPNYGHGKRQTEYKATTQGNGYLLVIYDKSDDSYLTSVTGMPQTMAVMPFKAPIDENKIKIEWHNYTDEWGNKFDDGEEYSLIYPEVTIPADAFAYGLIESKNGKLDISQVGVRLESTIGVYGTGLLDAIADKDIIAQYEAYEKRGLALNPAVWKDGAPVYYKGLDGKEHIRRYTYALSRGPVQDGPGSNAIWNITNVTRSDRRYHYMTTAYAHAASQDKEVQEQFYTYFPGEKTDKGVEYDIYRYLTGKEDGKNIADIEMKDEDFKNFMVWHRGLAVPAARNLTDPTIQKGHDLFREIGCSSCHRPSWTTGDDEIQDPNGMLTNADLPRYPNQTIWPYTDMVQHRLFMKNDIRTGWCRTTPLWGRGLCRIVENTEDRLHDCRARNTLEAIMWHGCSSEGAVSDAQWAVKKFRALSKEERDAVIAFIDAI